MKVDIPLGDVVDKITILRIKRDRLTSPHALANVRHELRALLDAWHDAQLPRLERLPEWEDLVDVNGRLWDVEDALRGHEARGDFGEAFVALARSVYKLNDRRAALKRSINDALGSSFVEEKSYVDWRKPQE